RRRGVGSRPFFFRREEKANRKLEWDFLYPITTYRRSEEDWEFKFIELFSFGGEGSLQAGREERADISPFYFSGTRENGENYFAIMPFWGKVYDRFFGEEAEWVLFPLYYKKMRLGEVTTFFPWPILSVTSGATPEQKYSGFRFTPLFGYELKEGISEMYFALWPIFLYQRTGLARDESEETQRGRPPKWTLQDEAEEMLFILPFYASRRSPTWDSTSVLWPLFTYTDDRQKNYEQWDVAWPFFRYARGEGRQLFQLFPLYMDDRKVLHNEFLFREIRYRDRFLLFPLYVRNEEEYPDGRKVRDRILWYIYSDAREEGRDGSTRRIDFWPFAHYERDREGAVMFQTLALLEAFLPANEWIARNYSPLWSLYTYRRNPGGEAVYSFLWNLLRHEETQEGRSIEVLGPLLHYREAGADAAVSLLGGLVQYEVRQGERSVRLFGEPVISWSERPQAVAVLDPRGGNR
ncbi:MAG: hypothetical protein WCI75_10815, partial [candidate division NC10 bacterium]